MANNVPNSEECHPSLAVFHLQVLKNRHANTPVLLLWLVKILFQYIPTVSGPESTSISSNEKCRTFTGD